MDDKLALVNFVLLYGDGTKWLYSKKASVWEAASKFVLDFCGSHRTSEFWVMYLWHLTRFNTVYLFCAQVVLVEPW